MSTPNPHDPAHGGDREDQRPDLHVVPDDTDPTDIDTSDADADAEMGPMLDDDGNPVAPRAPLDVRLREAALSVVGAVPALGQAPGSFRESIEYSAHADWATSDNGLKRGLHALATLVAFALTYPLVDLLGAARQKPGPFTVAVLIVIALGNVLALAL